MCKRSVTEIFFFFIIHPLRVFSLYHLYGGISDNAEAFRQALWHDGVTIREQLCVIEVGFDLVWKRAMNYEPESFRLTASVPLKSVGMQ
ncbi:hypothetical protein NPIL_182601 [Nephila pilipes]|uniref:Uncharacterized protein n=1 Tax=Nephila pilipes TaxID=299642 RepID=A0A8X6QRG1_NEPPI|nr:hypothetical protein NPIL_182601 [Nephila pilipes]